MSIPRVPIYIFGILRHHVIMIHIHFLWSLLIQISFKTSVALLFLIGALRFHGPTMALPINKETRFTITGKCTKTLNPFVSRYYTVLPSALCSQAGLFTKNKSRGNGNKM